METIQEFFKYGMDRDVNDLWQPPPASPRLNIGPGNIKVIPNTFGVGLATDKLTSVLWVAPSPLPYEAESVGEIHCYHFLEHFEWEDVVRMLRDFERVLMPTGVLNIVVPYYKSNMAYHALDHKTHWTEEVWKWLFDCDYYASGGSQPWAFRLHFNMIMGIVERNLALFSQLVKE